MTVAETFRRKRKMTRMTRDSVSNRVNFTSVMESWIETERS